MPFQTHSGTEPRTRGHHSAWKWLRRGWPERAAAGRGKHRLAPVEQRVRVDHILSLRLPSMDSNPALFQNLLPIPICCEAMLL